MTSADDVTRTEEPSGTSSERNTSSSVASEAENDYYSNVKSFSDKNNKTYNFWDEQHDITSFNMDLHNLAMDNAQTAQDALEIMEDLHQNDPENPSFVKPNAASYTTVMEGWCYGNQDSEEGPQKSQELLDKMIDKGLVPNELTYFLVCQKWAESYKHDRTGANAQRAQDLLRLIPSPSAKLYSIVLEGWCRRVGKVPHAMDKAEQLLQEMENHPTIRPNVLTYTSVIGGLARSKERDLATRADQLLIRMKQTVDTQGVARSNSTVPVEPDMVAYTSILNCWAKTTSRKERERAADRALEILQEMEEQYIHYEKYHLKPNQITYATAIKAIGNSFHPNAKKLAENILHRMYNLTESGLIHVPPNVGTYNAVINSLSSNSNFHRQSANDIKRQRLADARRAEHLLVDMIKRARGTETVVEPNVRTWGAVLRAWAESGQPDSGEQAQRVLDQLQQWYNEGKTNVRPNVVCFTTVMNAWGRGKASPKVALDAVEHLLKTMETLFEESGDMDIRPNKISYVTAIDVFCRKCNGKGDNSAAAVRAQSVVDRMMRLYSKGIGFDRPTRIIFNALINAWSRSKDSMGAVNAEKIFRWMESQYRAGDTYVQPDEMTLCGVLNAWANHAQDGGAMRAQEILDHTESLSVEERGFSHSIICHNILIKAWGRSRSPDSVQRAEAILNKLEDQYKKNKNKNARPDVTTYSSVINCCAYYAGNDAKGQQEAFEVALRTFRKIKENSSRNCEEGPNNITYGTLFKAIARLTPMDDTRKEIIKTFFNQCCREGQVDSFVLSQVRAASPSTELYHQLISPSGVRDGNNMEQILKRMPQEWGKRVVY